MKRIETVYVDHKNGVAILTYDFELFTREVVLNSIFVECVDFFRKEDLEWDYNKRILENKR